MAVVSTHRLYPLLLLALDTGMRSGEIIALEWTDIDFTTGFVSITKSARSGEKGGVRIKEVKTKASRRRIKLSPPTLEALRAWREQTPGRIVFPSRGRGATSGKDCYLLKGNLLRSFKKLLQKAELPLIRFHDLRHTHATLALVKTKNIKAIAVRLGHDDIQVTLKTYAHWLPTMEEELVAAMEALLSPTVKPEEPAEAPAAPIPMPSAPSAA